MRPADPDGVVRTARDDAFPADADVVRVLDRSRYAVAGAEAKEEANTVVRAPLGAPEVLIEVVVDRPRVVDSLERLRRHEQLWEEPLHELPDDGAGITQAGSL